MEDESEGLLGDEEGGNDRWVEVRESPIHGLGLFAKQEIKPGFLIGRYEGEQTKEDGTYVLWVFNEEGEEIGVDGRNELRFVNHGDPPNAEFEDLNLYVTEPIPAGAEILIDYGAGWES